MGRSSRRCRWRAAATAGRLIPNTMEAFSSHGNGTLSVIKENSPTDFVVEETVQTKSGGKTCTVDTKSDHVIVITREAVRGRSGKRRRPRRRLRKRAGRARAGDAVGEAAAVRSCWMYCLLGDENWRLGKSMRRAVNSAGAFLRGWSRDGSSEHCSPVHSHKRLFYIIGSVF